MWIRLKHALGYWFFADIKAKLDLERESFTRISADYRAGLDNLAGERIRLSNDVVALVRAQLSGFDPKLLDDDRDMPEVLGEVEGQDAFLAKMKTLNDTPELWQLVAFLTRNQIMHAVKEAQTLEAINFARATLNGLSLLREEVARLATVYAARHAAAPEFDEHEVV